MKIEVKQYHFENLFNKLFDCDWLDAELVIVVDSRTVKITLGFLIVEELESIQFWLLQVLNKTNLNKTLDFVDPNMQLKIMTRSKIQLLKVMYSTQSNEIVTWELIINEKNINDFVDEIKIIISNFPSRYNFISHPI